MFSEGGVQAAQIIAHWQERAEACRAGKEIAGALTADGLAADYRVMFGLLLRFSFDGITFNDRRSRWILEVSDSFCALTGYARRELIGRTSVELGLVADDELRARITGRVDRGIEGLYELKLRRKDGALRSVELSQTLLPGNELVLTVIRDVTERRLLEEREALIATFETLALTDQLTGLPNRRAWDEQLMRTLSHAARTGQPLSVALVDLDRFKDYNDARGHPAGDELLALASTAWRSCLRGGDLLARHGGDEFAALFPGQPLKPALGAVERLRAATPNQQTCSAGVACWDGIETADELVGRADAALYEAKNTGRDRTQSAP